MHNRIRVPAWGSRKASIMVVGEAPGEQEEKEKLPFVGASGVLLTKVLAEVGIQRSYCYITNVCKYRPPGNKISSWFYTAAAGKKLGASFWGGRFFNKLISEGLDELQEEINRVRPKVIIALGETALWALTGNSKITKWRGSYLWYEDSLAGIKIRVIPTYHPAAVLRQWGLRVELKHDLKKARWELFQPKTPPAYEFTIRPSESDVLSYLEELIDQAKRDTLHLSCDTETKNGFNSCIGIGSSKVRAMCIPLTKATKPYYYWDHETELLIIAKLAELLTSPNVITIFQNGLYDCQYLASEWGFIPRNIEDTMLMQHVCFPNRLKGLDYISSMCTDYHVYWKDEGKIQNPKVQEDQWWVYNCKDCVTTHESFFALKKQIEQMRLQDQYAFQMRMFRPILRTMLRGVRFDRQAQMEQAFEMAQLRNNIMRELDQMVEGIVEVKPKAKPWYGSPKQLSNLLYETLGLKPVRKRSSNSLTTDDQACEKIIKREPAMAPLLQRILELRSAGVYEKTFLSAMPGPDGRMRCSYNIAGTITFRLSSSKDAWGSGMNLQNVPRPEED